MKYWIITAETNGELDIAVNKEIAAGWQPIGGVAVTSTPGTETRECIYNPSETWAQAMVHKGATDG